MTEQDTRCGVCGYVHPAEGFVQVDDGPDMAALIHQEAMAVQRFHSALTDVVEAIDNFDHLWVWGDGYGGWVYDEIRKAFDTAGYLSESHFKSRPKTKKQLPAKLRAQVMARDGLRCVFCGCDDLEQLGVDHIVAEANGGAHTIDNLQTLCGPCNSKKGTK